jgi:predicted metal-dependent enzyme (double-stranded beta helix superfamily)
MINTARFRTFVRDFTLLADKVRDDEVRLLDTGSELLHGLVSHDDWLPDPYSQPDPQRYRQCLLHCDPLERFSVVSFVWGPGQRTPVHDHTVWGLIGILRGSERCREFAAAAPGEPLRVTGEHLLERGEIDRVSPRIGDIHEVSNALADRASVSIHVYGANIGAVHRHVYDPLTGAPEAFVSGYSLPMVPNWWDRSAVSS